DFHVTGVQTCALPIYSSKKNSYMKRILILGLSLGLLWSGCKKESFDDTSFAEGAGAPDKLSVMFDITQDNTGKVSIYPNGEGIRSEERRVGKECRARR